MRMHGVEVRINKAGWHWFFGFYRIYGVVTYCVT